jgi:acetaldehyde dehydrogenase (acetylating)
MSSTSLYVVEVAYAPDGTSVVHVDGWSPLTVATMQTVPAGGLETYLMTSDTGSAAVAVVKADIQSRIASGSSTPVTKAHLDDLGITAAVLQWAQE